MGRRALARTSRTPGRTRACNVFNVGDRFYYVDLPGYGYASGSHAQRRALGRLIEEYVTGRDPAGAVWLVDARRDPSADDLALGSLLTEHSIPALITLTKVDKVPRRARPERVRAVLEGLEMDIAPERCVLTSARTGEGIVALRKAIDGLVERS